MMKSCRPKTRAQRDRERQHHREAGEERAGDEVRREDRRVPAGRVADREVERDDAVHRDHQRRREPGEQQVGRSRSAPSAAPRRASRARAGRRRRCCSAAVRAVAQRREVGQQADVPEQQRDDEVGGDREDVPDQRAAPLRPEVHRVGVGQQPVEEPRPAEVQDREQPGACRRRTASSPRRSG